MSDLSGESDVPVAEHDPRRLVAILRQLLPNRRAHAGRDEENTGPGIVVESGAARTQLMRRVSTPGPERVTALGTAHKS
jgi:hypothetical protein